MGTIKECFINARRDEQKGKKHKGLLFMGRDDKKAIDYIEKAKTNLRTCELFKREGLDYKTLRNSKEFLGHQKFLKKFFSVPEEWFYTQYYCGLAILAKFGVESRSQKCTALFLRYVKEKGLIDYDPEFIDRITVYSDKQETSDVDEREKARYGSSVKNEETIEKYEWMMEVCKRCISQCEEIVFSEHEFKVPEEFLK